MSNLQGSAVMVGALSFVRAVLYPSYISFNWLLSLYIPTCLESLHPLKILTKKVLLTPVYAVLFITFLPSLIVFLPIRCLLVSFRQPFLYSERNSPLTRRQTEIINELIKTGVYKFGIATANLCLMPELASKMNSLKNVDSRAKKIGERIILSQFFCDDWINQELWWKHKVRGQDHSIGDTEGILVNVKSRPPSGQPSDVVGDICTTFPLLDFLVIQEAWSSYHNKALMLQLHKVFPYIVHDVGAHSFQINHFILNSGLLLASKHPVLAVNFRPYSYSVKHGKMLSLGLLMVKISVGIPKGNRRNVGFIFNTHLQSYQGKEQIISKQLCELQDWTHAWVNENTQSEDNILFVLLCGDFNFDNLSPADAEVTRHPIFDDYVDVCRLSPGIDKPWTIGTEMRQDHLFDSLVTSPEGLKAAMEEPALRQCHIIDADIVEHTHEALAFGNIRKDEQNNVIVFPEGGRRRIDYIMYHKSYPVNVEAFHFVTQLASLTDHIPVSMEFQVKLE